MGEKQTQKGAKRTTIADVSQALGLTKSTVSRALNGYPDISEATRLRVLRMSEKLGYRPLSQAQAIRTGRARAIGLVVQLSEHDAHRPFLAEFLAGLSQSASAEGWTLTVAAADSEAATLGLMRDLVQDRKADGFILPRTLWDDPRVKMLREDDVPFVLFGRVRAPEGCAYFDVLGEEAVSDAVARLAALGHRRIGFVNGSDRYAYSHFRRDGYRAGLAKAGIEFDPALMVEGALSSADGSAASAVLLGRPAPPTAIIFATDKLALGAYETADRLGLRVGADVSFVGYDGAPEGAAVRPGLTSYGVDYRSAGEVLASQLIARIEGADPDGLRRLVPASFCARASMGPPAQSSEALAARIAAPAG